MVQDSFHQQYHSNLIDFCSLLKVIQKKSTLSDGKNQFHLVLKRVEHPNLTWKLLAAKEGLCRLWEEGPEFLECFECWMLGWVRFQQHYNKWNWSMIRKYHFHLLGKNFVWGFLVEGFGPELWSDWLWTEKTPSQLKTGKVTLRAREWSKIQQVGTTADLHGIPVSNFPYETDPFGTEILCPRKFHMDTQNLVCKRYLNFHFGYLCQISEGVAGSTSNLLEVFFWFHPCKAYPTSDGAEINA